MIIGRYPKIRHITTHLNQLEDLVDWLGYLTSPEYLTDILVNQHNLTATDAKSRAPKIITHVTTAISLINQSLNGPPEVSFLPAYYAILDLAKVYILLGPRHADLPRHRWHGATYSVTGKDSHSLLTEVITLKKGGALALFYETLTGKPVLHERTIKMRDIYPYIYDVSAEHQIATNYGADVVALRFQQISLNNGNYQIQARVLENESSKKKFSSRNIAALSRFTKIKGQQQIFTTPVFCCSPDQVDKIARQYVDCRLLYSNDPEQYSETAIANKSFPMPEEFPIALLFFHMSSVVRYKPEFLEKIKYGKYWPILASAKRHSLRKFLVLFWSFVHNEQLIMHAA